MKAAALEQCPASIDANGNLTIEGFFMLYHILFAQSHPWIWHSLNAFGYVCDSSDSTHPKLQFMLPPMPTGYARSLARMCSTTTTTRMIFGRN